jgi:hypothetical protein
MSEVSFRLAICLLGTLALGISVYHRIQAASSGEPISLREEGYLFATVLRLAGMMLGISTLGYLLVPETIRWARMPLPDWVRWAGAASGGMSVLLLYGTLTSLGKNLTDTVVTRTRCPIGDAGPLSVGAASVLCFYGMLDGVGDFAFGQRFDWRLQHARTVPLGDSHAEGGTDAEGAVWPNL